MEEKRVCLVTGVGEGTGASLCRRFAAGGYAVAMLARSGARLAELARGISGARPFAVDVADADALRQVLAEVREEIGPVEVAIHNAGAAAFGDVLQVSASQLEEAWRVNVLALFVLGQELGGEMAERGSGAILATGATASLRGGAGFAAFAPAKAAQRSLIQSMARALGPRGVHVGYVVVDGVIDLPRTRRLFSGRPDEDFLRPDAIAEAFYFLAHQDRSAWTLELDLRPFTERF